MLCGHRYYDPSIGRFLTRDPIGYEGGINLYSFCGNNPVNFNDPSGLFRIIITMGINGYGYGYVVADEGDTDANGNKYQLNQLIIGPFPTSNRPAGGHNPFPPGTWPITGIRHAHHFGAGAVLLGGGNQSWKPSQRGTWLHGFPKTAYTKKGHKKYHPTWRSKTYGCIRTNNGVIKQIETLYNNNPDGDQLIFSKPSGSHPYNPEIPLPEWVIP